MRITKTIQIYTIILALSLIMAGAAHAATTMEIGIPGQINPGDAAPSVPMYIKYLYLFVLGFVGIAGFASIVFWGAVWAGSGVVDKKAAALDGIKNALYGIGIALTAFILLNTINPDLTVIKAPSVPGIPQNTWKSVGSSPAQIKQMTDYDFCHTYTPNNASLCLSNASDRCAVFKDSGGVNICIPKAEATCLAYTNQSTCLKTISESCQWASNACYYVPK